jgi:hypothetical protein
VISPIGACPGWRAGLIEVAVPGPPTARTGAARPSPTRRGIATQAAAASGLRIALSPLFLTLQHGADFRAGQATHAEDAAKRQP